MPVVIEKEPGVLERIGGNPVLLSLDGKVRAPLQTILAPSWTAEDRAKFGVFVAEPFVDPEGKVRIGMPTYSKDADGKVIETFKTEPLPAPKVLTVEDKLARIGLTLAELKAALA